jgi:hypothetical protein
MTSIAFFCVQLIGKFKGYKKINKNKIEGKESLS